MGGKGAVQGHGSPLVGQDLHLPIPGADHGLYSQGHARQQPGTVARRAEVAHLGGFVERMSGRRVCQSCGAPYHVKAKPPKQEGVCDTCGGPLAQRDDDKAETVRKRLEVYHAETEPLKGYYEGKGILSPVANQDTIEGTTQVIMEALGI